MNKQQLDKIAVTAGSMLFVNGGLLLLSPGRFATIRKAGWTPRRVDEGLDWLARHDEKSRPIGLILATLGFGLLLFGLFREPRSG